MRSSAPAFVDASVRERYAHDGYVAFEHFLSEQECSEIIADVQRLKSDKELYVIDRADLLATQKFYTLFGAELEDRVRHIRSLWHERVQQAVHDLLEEPDVKPMSNKDIGVSLNVTPPGGQLSFHYDRNEITGVLHLNEVAGGEIEFYPHFRFRFRNRYHPIVKWFQRAFDVLYRTPPFLAAFGRRHEIKPQSGTLLLMRGDECLHRVLPVEAEDRFGIVFCYDRTSVHHEHDASQDYYGYQAQKMSED